MLNSHLSIDWRAVMSCPPRCEVLLQFPQKLSVISNSFWETINRKLIGRITGALRQVPVTNGNLPWRNKNISGVNCWAWVSRTSASGHASGHASGRTSALVGFP